MAGPKFLINPVTKGNSAISRRNSMNQSALTLEICQRLGLYGELDPVKRKGGIKGPMTHRRNL